MFSYVLAGELGGMTRDEMMRRMSSEEFVTWRVIYEKLAPFGNLRQDVRAGQVAAPIVNAILSAAGVKDPGNKPSDWILPLLKEPVPEKPQSQEDIKFIFKALADAHKIKEERHKKPKPVAPVPVLPVRISPRPVVQFPKNPE